MEPMLRSHESQIVWRCTGVLVAMGADVERVVPREKSYAMYCRTFGEPSPVRRRIFSDASENIRGRICAKSANSLWEC